MSRQDNSDLKVGDRVTWTHASSNGSSWRFRTREGKVVGFEGGYVIVRYRGRSFGKSRTDLRKAGETTELTQAFTDITDAYQIYRGGPAHKEQPPAAASKEYHQSTDEPTTTRNEGPSGE